MKYLLIIASLFVAGFAYGQTVSVVAETGEFIGVPTAARIDAIEAGTKMPLIPSGKIIVGNSGGTGEAQTVTGDISLSNEGVAAIAAGVIVDADINENAAIAGSKLATAVQDSLALAGSAVQTEADPVVAAIIGLVKSDGTTISAAAAGTDYLAPGGDGSGLSGIAAAPSVAGSVATTTNTVTITAKDGAAGTIEAARLMRVWVSEATYGIPSTNNIESVTLSGGTAIQTVSAGADYIYLTGTNGTASAEVVGTAAGTNYINVADGGYVTSAAVVFEAGE